MPAILPPSRPAWPREKVAFKLAAAHILAAVVLVGVRGYFRDTMGKRGRNDRNIYDDAIFVYSPNAFASFNANTDPSVTRDGVAVLKTGLHLYRKGLHGISRGSGYPALRPATKDEELPVTRTKNGKSVDGVGVAINIHKGGYTTTSSLGCQTIFPDQWAAFIALVYGEMDRCGAKTIPYLLVEGQG